MVTNDDKTENTETKARCRCKKRTNVHFYLEPTCIILSRPDGAAEVQPYVVLMPHSSHKRAIATCGWEVQDVSRQQPTYANSRHCRQFGRSCSPAALVAGIQAGHDTKRMLKSSRRRTCGDHLGGTLNTRNRIGSQVRMTSSWRVGT